MSEFTIKGKPIELHHVYPFRIGLISDLHVGAQHGLFPPDFTDEHGTTYKINEGQRILWDYFNQYINKLNEFKINILIVLGDLIGGKNVKELGTYMTNVDLNNQQIPAVVSILKYVCEEVPTIEKVIILRGTPYHGAKDTSVEDAISDKLYRALDGKIDIEFRGEYTYLTLAYKGFKKVVWLAHPATGATVYPETVLGRDIGWFLQASAQGKLPQVDMIIRAHRHEFMELHKSSIRYMVLPCWQFFVPYNKAIENYSKWQPDIGGAILLADEECRLRPFHFVYPNIVNPERFLTFNHQAEKTVKHTPMPKEARDILKKRD
jgi:hypothetical protein